MKYSDFLAELERQRIDRKVCELEAQLRLEIARFGQARIDKMQDCMHPDGPSIDWDKAFEWHRREISRIKQEIEAVD